MMDRPLATQKGREMLGCLIARTPAWPPRRLPSKRARITGRRARTECSSHSLVDWLEKEIKRGTATEQKEELES